MALVFTPAFEGLTFKSADVVAPEFSLVGQGVVWGVEVEVHFTNSLVGHFYLKINKILSDLFQEYRWRLKLGCKKVVIAFYRKF